MQADGRGLHVYLDINMAPLDGRVVLHGPAQGMIVVLPCEISKHAVQGFQRLYMFE